MHKNEGTIKQIHEQFGEGRSLTRTHQHSLEAGFPEPLYLVGRNKIYDMRQVARFYATRTDRRKTA